MSLPSKRGIGTSIPLTSTTTREAWARDSGTAAFHARNLLSKLDGPFQGNDRAIGGLDESLRRLGTDHVDRLLIHWPLPQRGQYVSTWKMFEKLLAAGKTRSIGLSNFKPAHIERLLA